MKILFISIFAILLLFSSTVYAQKVLTLHSSGVVTRYTGLNAFVDAYNTANSGDTIYMPGAAFNAPATFNKFLVVFGAGHSLDSTLVTGKTFLTGGITFYAAASNSYFEGIEFASHIILANNTAVNQVTFKRCKFNSIIDVQGTLTTPSTNLALIDNVCMNSIYLNNAVFALITNCIIQGVIENSESNIFSNNIFLYTGGWVFSVCNNNQIMNNVFIENGGLIYGTGNIFTNNLMVNASPNYGAFHTLSGNYTGVPQSNIFTNQSGYTFNYLHDYHIQSPTTYLGTDGSQVGIYGGSFASKIGWVPTNPHIQFKNIAPQTDNNGDLNIQLKVGAQNN